MRREWNFKSKESNREFGNTQHISAILSRSISPNILSDVLSAILEAMGSHGNTRGTHPPRWCSLARHSSRPPLSAQGQWKLQRWSGSFAAILPDTCGTCPKWPCHGAPMDSQNASGSDHYVIILTYVWHFWSIAMSLGWLWAAVFESYFAFQSSQKAPHARPVLWDVKAQAENGKVILVKVDPSRGTIDPPFAWQLHAAATAVHWSSLIQILKKKLLPVGPTPRLSVPRLSHMFRLLVLPSELPSKSLVSMKIPSFHQGLIRVTDVLVFSELFILDSNWFQIFPLPVILLLRPRARRPFNMLCIEPGPSCPKICAT